MAGGSDAVLDGASGGAGADDALEGTGDGPVLGRRRRRVRRAAAGMAGAAAMPDPAWDGTHNGLCIMCRLPDCSSLHCKRTIRPGGGKMDSGAVADGQRALGLPYDPWWAGAYVAVVAGVADGRTDADAVAPAASPWTTALLRSATAGAPGPRDQFIAAHEVLLASKVASVDATFSAALAALVALGQSIWVSDNERMLDDAWLAAGGPCCAPPAAPDPSDERMLDEAWKHATGPPASDEAWVAWVATKLKMRRHESARGRVLGSAAARTTPGIARVRRARAGEREDVDSTRLAIALSILLPLMAAFPAMEPDVPAATPVSRVVAPMHKANALAQPMVADATVAVIALMSSGAGDSIMGAGPPSQQSGESVIRAKIVSGTRAGGRAVVLAHLDCLVDSGAEVCAGNFDLLPPGVRKTLTFRPADRILVAANNTRLSGDTPLMCDMPLEFTSTRGAEVARTVRVYDAPSCIYSLILGRTFTHAEGSRLNWDEDTDPAGPYVRLTCAGSCDFIPLYTGAAATRQGVISAATSLRTREIPARSCVLLEVLTAHLPTIDGRVQLGTTISPSQGSLDWGVPTYLDGPFASTAGDLRVPQRNRLPMDGKPHFAMVFNVSAEPLVVPAGTRVAFVEVEDPSAPAAVSRRTPVVSGPADVDDEMVADEEELRKYLIDSYVLFASCMEIGDAPAAGDACVGATVAVAAVEHAPPQRLCADRDSDSEPEAEDRQQADGMARIGLPPEGPARSTPAVPIPGADAIVFEVGDAVVEKDLTANWGPTEFAVWVAWSRVLLAKRAKVFDDRPSRITGLPDELLLRLKLRPDANRRSLMQPLRRVSVQERDVISEFVRELLAGGVVEHSQSPFGAAVVLTRKKTGSGLKGWRFCIDFRALNRALVHSEEAWPMRRADDCLARLSGCKYFTSVDLRAGFWQMDIHPDDRPLLAFRSHSAHLQFTCLPMGLSASSGAFQRMSEFLCQGLVDHADGESHDSSGPVLNGGGAEQFVMPYVDDFLVYSQGDHYDHMRKVDRMLEVMEKHNVTLKYDKCSFARSSVDFLGFHVGRGGMQPQGRLVSKLRDMAPPTCTADLRSLEGLFSYYRVFLQGYSAETQCFRDAALATAHNRSPFLWSTECEETRQRLIRRLTTYEQDGALAFPDFAPGAGAYLICTDAATSGGLGATLSQVGRDGVERVIAFASRRLTRAESRYGVTQLECLAVVFAVRKFRWAIHGRPFSIVTDHRALTWLDSVTRTDNPGTRMLQGWALELSEHRYTLRYRPGPENGAADAMSRLVHLMAAIAALPFADAQRLDPNPLPPRGLDVLSSLAGLMAPDLSPATLSPLMAERYTTERAPITGTAAFPVLPSDVQMAAAQRACPFLGPVMAYLDLPAAARDPGSRLVHLAQGAERARSWSLAEMAESHWLSASGVLLRAPAREFRVRGAEEGGVVCVPESLRRAIMALFHDDMAHVGTGRLVAALQRSFSWPGMASSVAEWVSQCASCSATKSASTSQRRVSGAIPLPLESWDTVFVDIIGPLTESPRGNRYALVAVCAATRWVEVIPMASVDSKSVLSALESLIWDHGAPHTIWSDRGSQLLSKEATEVYDMLGVNKISTSAYRQAANGCCERTIKTLKSLLAATLASQASHESWEERLPRVLFAMRTAVSEGLGFSPFSLMYGREATSPVARALAEAPRTRVGYAPELAERLAHLRKLSQLIWEESRERSRAGSARAPHERRLLPVYVRGDYVRVVVERQASGDDVAATFLPTFTGPYFVQGPAPGSAQTYIVSRTSTSVPFLVDAARLKRVPLEQRGELPALAEAADGVGAGRGVHIAPALPPLDVEAIVDSADNVMPGLPGRSYLVRFRAEGMTGDRWMSRDTLALHNLGPLLQEFDAVGSRDHPCAVPDATGVSIPAPVVAESESARTHDRLSRRLRRGPPSDWSSICDMCHAVKAGDTRLLMCDYCVRSYHRSCVGRRAHTGGYWRCPVCVTQDARELVAAPAAAAADADAVPAAPVAVKVLSKAAIRAAAKAADKEAAAAASASLALAQAEAKTARSARVQARGGAVGPDGLEDVDEPLPLTVPMMAIRSFWAGWSA